MLWIELGPLAAPQNFGSFPKHLPVFLVTSQPLRRSGSPWPWEMKWWGPKPQSLLEQEGLLLSTTIFLVINLSISRRSEEAQMNLRERQDTLPASSSSPVPFQSQLVEPPETSLMHLPWQGVPCPQPPPWQPWPQRWAEGPSCPPALAAACHGSACHRAAESNHHSSDSSGGVSRPLDSLSVTADRKKSPVIQKWIPAGPPGNS